MNFTQNLLADVRHRYETTLESLTTLAFDLGICRTTLRSFAEKQGWVRYNAPPRDISPAARLARQTEAFFAGVTGPEPPRPAATASAEPALPLATPDAPLDGPATADWLRREVQAQISIVKTLREQERAEPLTVEQVLLLGRVLVQLTDTFIKLSRHTDGASPLSGVADDFPENIDEFRNELARRIDAFVASRADAADADHAAA